MAEETITREEFKRLEDALAEIAKAQKALQDAETAREKEAARLDVAEADEDFKELADRLGVKPSDIRAAQAQAKRREVVDVLKNDPEAFDELMESYAERHGLVSESDNGESDGEETESEEEKPKGLKKPPAQKKTEDEPESQHWSERPFLKRNREV